VVAEDGDYSFPEISGQVTQAQLKTPTPDWVNVQTFGADPTGATDSTVAIQNAFNSAGTKGVPLYFPAGTYKISSSITATSTPTPPALIGDGSQTTIISNTSVSEGGFTLTLTVPITISGLQFKGTGTYTAEIQLTNGGGTLYDVYVTNTAATYSIIFGTSLAVFPFWNVDSCYFNSKFLMGWNYGSSSMSGSITNTTALGGFTCAPVSQVSFANCIAGGNGLSITTGWRIVGSNVTLDNCIVPLGTTITSTAAFDLDTPVALALRNCTTNATAGVGFYLSNSQAMLANCTATECALGFGLYEATSLTELGGMKLTNCHAAPTSAGVGFQFQLDPQDPATSVICEGCTVAAIAGTGGISFNSTDGSGGIILIGCMDAPSNSSYSLQAINGGSFLTIGCVFANAIYAEVGGVGLTASGVQSTSAAQPNYLGSATASNASKLSAQTGTTTGNLVGTALGVYRISGYLECTTAGAAGTLQTTITWTDDNGSQSANLLATPLSLATKGFATGELIVKAVSGSIAFSTAITSGSGSPAYDAALTAELIG
jgi:hypothetical protein